MSHPPNLSCSLWKVYIPLGMKGPVPVVPISKPTPDDVNMLRRLQLTSDDVLWDLRSIFEVENSLTHSLTDYDDDHYISCAMDMHMLLGLYEIKSMRVREKGGKCSATHLAKSWGIGTKAAERIITATTQLSRRDMSGNVSRRVRTKVHQRRYRQLDGHLGRFSSDTFFSPYKSLRGNDCFQLFTNRASFTKAYAMESKGDAPFALNRFIHEVGVPTEIHTDGSKEIDSGQVEENLPEACNIPHLE